MSDEENQDLVNSSDDYEEDNLSSDDCLFIDNHESSSQKSVSSLELKMRKIKLFKYFIKGLFKSKL